MPNYFVHTLLRARDWQPRQQFDDVCQWWRDGGLGVCALVGMGGAGKTAVADRFVNQLLGDTASSRLQVAESIFVFSFYDDDKPENFFHHLQCWLEGTSTPDKVKSATQLMFDIQQHQGLMILDGLEKVQESGARGGFGKLTSPSLRELLNHIASGSARRVSVLVTSRFPLTDLRDSQPRFFRTIPVDQIEVAAGIALLRERGVRGSDLQLESIVEHCGRHALTIDLAGGYIKEYGNGDPSTPLNLGTAEELQTKAEEEPNESKRAVLIQSHRFSRIAQRYRETMLKSDEAALALLERICLFRLGADCETIGAIFTGPDAKEVSGEALSALDRGQLQKKLDWLVYMRIVEANQSQTPKGVIQMRYSIHPAIRDGFLSGICRKVVQGCHEAVSQQLEVSLAEIPSGNPSDLSTLDLLEEVVHHTLRSGHVWEAIDFHRRQIGGWANLGFRLGAYERGVRICNSFVEQLQLEKRPVLQEHGLYHKHLGHLSDASAVFKQHAIRSLTKEEWSDAESSLLNLCDTQLDGGYIGGALSTAFEALQLCDPAVRPLHRRFEADLQAGVKLQTSYKINPWELSHANAYFGRAYTGLGNICLARESFAKAQRFQSMGAFDSSQPLISVQGVWNTDLLLRIGAHSRAIHFSNWNDKFCLSHHGVNNHFSPKCKLIVADAQIALGDLRSAQFSCTVARNWALARDAKEILCWSALVQARIDISKGRESYTHAGDIRTVAVNSSLGPVEFDLLFVGSKSAIEEGLKIARDCGYGLYHIDLLLERARLHLLRGNAEAAIEDINVALDFGVPANEVTGQVELLAANDTNCGYAWAIPFGLQLRAEVLLLRAAQSTRMGSINSKEQIDEAQEFLNRALELWQPLHDPEPEREDQNFKLNDKEYNYRAAETWRILKELDGGKLSRYPIASAHTVEASSDVDSECAAEPKDHRTALMSFLSELESYETSFSASDDEPIVECLSVEHPLNRAATELTHFYWAKKLPIKPRQDFRALIAESKNCEDFEAIEKLIFALSEWAESESSRLNNMVDQCEVPNRSAFSVREEKEQSMSFHVFLSHNSKDKPSVLLLKKRLVTDYQLSVWFDADQLRPGLPWQRLLEEGIRQSESIAVLIGSDGIGPWENEEMQAALQIGVRDGRPVIPVLLPDAPSKPELPMFLSNRTWVDLREGFRKDGLDQLVWGITGVKPNP